MDSFQIVDLRIEKANAILRCRRLQKITTLFRFLELFVVVVVISRLSALLPVTFKLSGEFLRRLSHSLLSPVFVFVLGNSIVVILYLKAGAKGDNGKKIPSDLSEDYIGNRENRRSVHREESRSQRKQSICEEEKASTVNMDCCRERKIYRSRSDNIKRERVEKARRELRRSTTEICPKSVNDSEKPAETSYSEEEMSSEDFRRTVEAFIARQQRLLREEEFSSVVSL